MIHLKRLNAIALAVSLLYLNDAASRYAPRIKKEYRYEE